MIQTIKQFNHSSTNCLVTNSGNLTLIDDIVVPAGSDVNNTITNNSAGIFTLDQTNTPGDKDRVYLPHKEIFEALEVGTQILLDDGKVKLEVTALDDTAATCKVIVGGPLSDRKGVNVPNAVLPRRQTWKG